MIVDVHRWDGNRSENAVGSKEIPAPDGSVLMYSILLDTALTISKPVIVQWLTVKKPERSVQSAVPSWLN